MDEKTFAAGIENSPYYRTVQELAAAEGAQVLPICAALEEEILLSTRRRNRFFCRISDWRPQGSTRMVSACYTLLGLISYLTAGEDEVRAWTIVKGTKAPAAAGKIHSDFERGFIRAETVAFDDLMQSGGMAGAREKGLVRSEGKEYVVQDGDVTFSALMV